MTSSASSVMRSLGGLIDLRDPWRHRQQVERIVRKAVAANLEVYVVGRRAAGVADERDQVARVDQVADLDQVYVVVGVDGREARLVLDLHHEAVPRLDPGRDDDTGGSSLHGCPERRLDIAPAMPAGPAMAKGRHHR